MLGVSMGVVFELINKIFNIINVKRI